LIIAIFAGRGAAPGDLVSLPLLHLHFDRFRFACWAFQQMHLEHAVLELGCDLSRVGILREGERAQECAIRALDPMEFLLLFFLLGLSLA
jgi:hypothetical protein